MNTCTFLLALAMDTFPVLLTLALRQTHENLYYARLQSKFDVWRIPARQEHGKYELSSSVTQRAVG